VPREKTLSTDLEFRTVCYHEAGHAVACYLYRIPIRSVTVVGHVAMNIMRAAERLEDWRERRSRPLAERIIRVCVAGEIAQKRHLRQAFRAYHSRHDWDYATNIAVKFSGSLKEAMAWCHYLYLNTQGELCYGANWDAIKKLAKELKTQKTIQGVNVLRIIRSVTLM
jgi:hypothetical protein